MPTYNEVMTGAILPAGDSVVNVYREEVGSGGVVVGDGRGCPVWVERLTNILVSNIALTFNNDNILKDIETEHETSAVNKQVLRTPRAINTHTFRAYEFNQTSGWCTTGDRCTAGQAYLPAITQKQQGPHLPPKVPA